MPVSPPDAPPELVDRVLDHLKASICGTDDASLASSLRHHLSWSAGALREVPEHSEQLPTTYDFAVTTAFGT